VWWFRLIRGCYSLTTILRGFRWRDAPWGKWLRTKNKEAGSSTCWGMGYCYAGIERLDKDGSTTIV
jgi:hypothetical protein